MDDIMALKKAAGHKPKMKRKAYEKELQKLQVELCHLQDWVKQKRGLSSCSKGATPPARAEPSRRSPNA
jgi:hypothetical protein